MATKQLRPYQIEDLAFYIRNPRCLNRSEPATGKTGSACMYVQWVYSNGGMTIFVNTSSIIGKNIDELLAFTDLQEHNIVRWTSDILKNPPKSVNNVACLFITADSLRMYWVEIMKMFPNVELLLADELHLYWSTHGEEWYEWTARGQELKRKGSQRTISFYRIMQKIPRFLGLTGTLIRGRLDSAYPVIQVIAPQIYGSYQGFLAKHAIITNYNRKPESWINHDYLRTILDCLSINRTFVEVYGKENKVVIPQSILLPEKQKAAYDEFHEMAMLELKNGEMLTTESPNTHVIRCRQILGHPDCVDGKVILDRKHRTGKEDWILDEIDPSQPTIIFSSLQPEQERLLDFAQRTLKVKAALINGNVTGFKRDLIDRDFRNGDIDWIICSPRCAGVGFNWERAENMIFASYDYMDDSYVQAYRRGIRGVRTTPLKIFVLRYKGTIERRILSIMETKSMHANLVDPTRERIRLLD